MSAERNGMSERKAAKTVLWCPDCKTDHAEDAGSIFVEGTQVPCWGELEERPALEQGSPPPAGDCEAFCSLCHEARSEPHKWEECAKRLARMCETLAVVSAADVTLAATAEDGRAQPAPSYCGHCQSRLQKPGPCGVCGHHNGEMPATK